MPCASVELKHGAEVAATELIEFCRTLLARFKAPKRIAFGEIPNTSLGTEQKIPLRDRVKSASAID